MDRDDQLLRGIADGAASPAALEARTGLTHATVWRGLHQLEGSGHVFSPARSVYRLTALGQTALSLPGQEPAMPQPGDAAEDGPPVGSGSTSAEGSSSGPVAPERHEDVDHCDVDRLAVRGDAQLTSAVIAGGFGWREVVALIVVALIVVRAAEHFVAELAARKAAVPLPVPPKEPPQPPAFVPPWANWG